MKQWFSNLSKTGKYTVIGVGVLLLILIGWFIYRYANRTNALQKAAEKARKQQGLQPWAGRPTTQLEWDELDGALRGTLGLKDNIKDRGEAEVVYSQALGFFKGLNLSWKNIIYFRNDLVEYVANGGDGEQFVTVGQYL
jgi:hypothetical protein